jgi:hypothetical protein
MRTFACAALALTVLLLAACETNHASNSPTSTVNCDNQMKKRESMPPECQGR